MLSELIEPEVPSLVDAAAPAEERPSVLPEMRYLIVVHGAMMKSS